MADLTPVQKLTGEELLAVIAKALEPPPAPPAPAFNHGGTPAITVTAYDALVPAGERMAYVPVALSRVPNQTHVVRALTSNDTATEGSWYTRVDTYLVFQPGEQVKVVPIPVKADLGSKRFKLILGWPQNDPVTAIADTTALISGDPAMLTNLPTGPMVADANGLPARPANLQLVFKEDFSNFQASDSGFLADGVTPCWRTRLGHDTVDEYGNKGRVQPGNNEAGYYADAVVNPGTQPHFKDAQGRVVLQSQYFPGGVPGAPGHLYTATVLTTQRLFPTVRRGDFVEARMTMSNQEGSWPAFWMIAADLSWPSIELDMFEGFFANPGSLAQVGTTVHWKNSTGGHSMFASRLPQLGIDITQPHTWGVYWGEKEVTFYCDNVPYFQVPNVFPDKNCYLKLNIAVGGLVGLPPDPLTQWPAQMPIEWVKVWR